MKPLCKAECDYLFWRQDTPAQHDTGFRKYAKTHMNRAKRRYFKDQIQRELWALDHSRQQDIDNIMLNRYIKDRIEI